MLVCPTCGRCGDGRLLDAPMKAVKGWLVWQTNSKGRGGIRNERSDIPPEMVSKVWLPLLRRVAERLEAALATVRELVSRLETSSSSRTAPYASVKGVQSFALLQGVISNSTFRSVPTTLRPASSALLRGVPLQISG